MEKIVYNPGLQHLAEKVFWNLDVKDLKNCAQINQSCKQILQNPIFCLRKFENLSKKNKNKWIKVIQSVKNSNKGIAIISYLKWKFKENFMFYVPCYSNSAVQENFFRKRIVKNCERRGNISDEEMEIVKILVPLTDNPNAPDKDGDTAIHLAAENGHTEIVKILASMLDNPNA